MSDLAARWETCLHEAAHCVTGRALCRWDTTAGAFVLESGRGGLATLPDGLSGWQKAVAIAAGRHAEALPFDPPARRKRPSLPTGNDAAAIRARATAEITEPARERAHKRSIREHPDEMIIAKYCACLHPTEPGDWRKTFDAVHAEAGRVVCEHRDEIRRVAVELFHRGEVTLRGDPEQDKIFAGGAVAAGE